LPPAGIAALVANRLQGRPAGLTLAFIQAKAQGNPFFAAELLNNLRESARLVRQENGEWWLANDVFEALRRNDCLVKQNGQWLLAENAPLSAVDLGLPASIQGTVLSRIDRLPESHKLTLKVASVVGRQFRLDLLASSHPTQPPADAVHAQMIEIEARDFVRQERSQGQPVPAYHFKHNVTQEVAYETLLFTQRQQLHQAVGRSLEQLQPDEIEQIAYHTFVGEDWRRALLYQVLAGREAQQHFANQEAVDHYRKALQCAQQLPAEEIAVERLDIHITLGELFVTIGQYEAAEEQLNQALTLARAQKDSEAQARACRWFARLHENRGAYQPALDWVQKGLFALVSQETSQVAELLLIAGLINTRQGDYDNATALAEHSLVIGQKLGDLSVLARAYNLMGIITRSRGNTTTAINHFQNSFQLYEQANDIHGQARSHNEIANAYFYTGQWTKADRHYRAARHIFKQVGNVYSQIVVDNNLGGIARNQGRLDEALTFYQQALQAQQQIGGSLWILGVLNMNLGQTYIQRGELEAAGEHLRRSEEYFGRAKARDFLPEMHRYFGEAALHTGDLATAESHAQKSKGLASEMGLRSEEGNSLRVLGEIAAAAGRLAEGEGYLRQSLTILQEVGDQFEWARSQLSLARLYQQWGKPGQAKAALADCLPIFAQLDAALEAARARELQARLGD
jgi:tetratricopeptide (TPR) repeat protein